MRPAAVIFDCDGVLVDSEPMSFELLAANLAAHGLHLPDAEMKHLFLGGTIAGAFTTARQLGATLPDGWTETFYEHLYARLAEGTALIPGVVDVLDALDEAGIPFAVGSNGSERKMQVTLAQHPALFRRLKGRLFSGQAIGAPKPAPDLYLHVARVLSVAPSRCAVIEDSPTGARAAAAASMPCFGYAPDGEGTALRVEGAKVFRTMADLPRLLEL